MLRSLKHFIALAEELHFTRAAERAGIEQSPLSRSIKKFEERLGIQLFERTKRSTRLTPAGERLFVHARALLAAVDEARLNVHAASANGIGHLHIGICDGVPLPRISRLITALKQASPNIDIHVHEVPMAQKVYELRNGLLDAAIASDSGYGKGIFAEVIWQDRPVALLPRNHPLAAKGDLVLADIVSEQLVLCRPDTSLGEQCQVEQLLRAATSMPNITNRATSLCMLVMLVLAGHGIGVTTAAQLEAVDSADLAIRQFCDSPTNVNTWLMMRDEELTDPLAQFIECARRVR